MERYHISNFMRLVSKSENNILSTLDPKKQALLKKLVISSILATDMSKHNHYVEMFKFKLAATKRLKAIEAGEQEKISEDAMICLRLDAFTKEDPNDKEKLLNGLVHACDIGNPCLKFNNYMNWAMLIT